MIIHVDEDIPLLDDFVWLTLGQIKQLMRTDNTVNMDTRTVISAIPFGEHQPGVIDFFNAMTGTWKTDSFQYGMLKSSLNFGGDLQNFDLTLSWLAEVKTKYELEVDKIPLKDVKHWIKTERDIHHEKGKFFKVIPVSVEIGNREVTQWTQPLMQPAQEGLIAFIVRKFNGIYHFLVQAKVECGNLDILELAPTVQCLTGNYRDTEKGSLPFLEYVLNAKPEQIIYNTLQSEEGGRFYREQNRNKIIDAGNDIGESLPENYTWMPLAQLKLFMKFNNYLNIQARSLISAIEFI